jgi:putative membrane protein
MTLTHETSLPAMDLAEPTEDQSFRERSSEATSHLVYGLVAERVRRFVRKLL